MRKISALSIVFVSALTAAPMLPAIAQEQTFTPRQIQNMIMDGKAGQATEALKDILAQHPDSGMAWYLLAEAQDSKGHEAAAAQALAKADRYAPGLPFANPQEAQALRTHINNGVASSGGHHSSGGVSIVLLVIVAFIALFVLLRMVAGWGRRPRYTGNPNIPYGGGYGPNGPGPYGPAGGGGGGMGGGLGSSIISGLAAGAGFAAGERIIGGLMGNGDAQAAQPPAQQDFAGSQDDGLNGDPGWDDSDDNSLNDDSW